jgi:hypothetical protein
MEPTEGPTKGGTLLHIYGIDFSAGKKVVCAFNDVKTKGKFL